MSELEIPSFIQKISWAEKHLEKLEGLIDAYTDSHPYKVSEGNEGNGKKERFVRRLRFTSMPDSDCALVAGDFLYNVRSGLDHLVGALVPASDRPHVMFPMLREKVWEIPYEEGENQERTDTRERWVTVTRRMDPAAVAILQGAQPIGRTPNDLKMHVLDVLNRLSNKDRHRKLSVISSGLKAPEVRWVMPDGYWYKPTVTVGENEGFTDGAELMEIPTEAVNVEIEGAVQVVIESASGNRHVPIPGAFRELLLVVREQLIGPLTPYLHGLPT